MSDDNADTVGASLLAMEVIRVQAEATHKQLIAEAGRSAVFISQAFRAHGLRRIKTSPIEARAARKVLSQPKEAGT